MKDFDPDEVFGHEFALTDRGKKANNSHYGRLECQGKDDPHQVPWHQIGSKFWHIFDIFIELSRIKSKVAVIDREDYASNRQEKSLASASRLLVGPIDAFLGEFEQIAQDGSHHENLHNAEANQDGLHRLKWH